MGRTRERQSLTDGLLPARDKGFPFGGETGVKRFLLRYAPLEKL